MKRDQNILLVDDERELRTLVAERLGIEGYNVLEADRVNDALRIMSHSHFDLLLLDVMLPDGTGLDVLRFMKDRGIKIPVIMLTGASGLEVAVESVKLGARDYVTKPAKIPYLLHSIKELLSGESIERDQFTTVIRPRCPDGINWNPIIAAPNLRLPAAE